MEVRRESTSQGDATPQEEIFPKLTIDIEKANFNPDPPEKLNSCEGSDSGVEVLEPPHLLQRTLSTNSANFPDFGNVTPARSCDSSIMSCGSNYGDVYNSLVRRNSTLLEEYKMRNSDGTSEGGSESSSVVSPRSGKRNGSLTSKRKVTVENKCRSSGVVRTKGKSPSRAKSTERLGKKAVPNSLLLNSGKKIGRAVPVGKIPQAKTTCKLAATPTDDGRWPSVHSKPAPLMTRSARCILPGECGDKAKKVEEKKKEARTVEKYATLPRRRKERSAEDLAEGKAREHSASRHPKPLLKTLKDTLRSESVDSKPKSEQKPRLKASPSKQTPFAIRRKTAVKTKIYKETSSQTLLTRSDIENALPGLSVNPPRSEELEKLTQQHELLNELYRKLSLEFEKQKLQLEETEGKLKEERTEKEGLEVELRKNTERVLAILGDKPNEENGGGDSLLVLENRFQDVSQIIIKQEREISDLHSHCRGLQKKLEKSVAENKSLLQQQKDFEAETCEMADFMKAEVSTLNDSLKESELEISRLKDLLRKKEEVCERRR